MANHRFEETQRPTNRTFAIAGRYVPGYFERMATWLEGVLSLRRIALLAVVEER